MAWTDYLKSKVNSHVFVKDVTYTPPSGLYLAAFTDAPSDIGTDGTEVTGGSYARQAITFVFAITTGRVENSADLTITNMPNCVVVALGVYDASSSGNLLTYGELSEPVTLTAGDPLTVPAGLLGLILP